MNFDRAASFYDQTRSHGPEVQARVTSLLAGELAGRGRCLEIGVGTGRIGLPLHRAGIPMAGVDISVLMVERLVEKAGGRPAFPLALADATRLPFGDGTFGAAVAAHVLHLIPPWRQAVAELVRVVRAGGVVVVHLTGGWAEPYREVRAQFARAAGLERVHVGVDGFEELDEAFAALGVSGRSLPQLVEVGEVTLDDVIGRFEAGTFSYTWSLDDDSRHRAAAEVREWARSACGPLDERRPARWTIAWRAYELAGAGSAGPAG